MEELPTKEPPISTEPPKVTPTDDNRVDRGTLELYDRILADKETELRALRERVNAPAPKAPEPAPDSAAFFADPAKVVGDLIDARLKESTGPLNAFVKEQTRITALNNYRNIVSNNPAVSKFWSYISAEFDNLATAYAKGDGPINDGVVASTVQSLIANFAMAQPLKYAELKGNEIKHEPPKVITPPSIPPSGSEPPAPTGDNKAPALSENEMRLARERWPNLSHQEAYKKYDSLRNPGSFVVVPKDKGGK